MEQSKWEECNVKQSCFAYALLVGKSFLQKDEQYEVLEGNRNADLTELYTTNEITNVYETAGVCLGPVRVDQCRLFYEKYLLPDNIDLVIFSKSQQDSIVYDSRLDDEGVLHRITNNVIFLWLNDAHYDLILSPKAFSRFNLSRFCFSCMQYYRRLETRQSHVCKTARTCQKWYAHESCAKEDGFKMECSECHVLFYNRTCECTSAAILLRRSSKFCGGV